MKRTGEPAGYTTYTNAQTVMAYNFVEGFEVVGGVVTNITDAFHDDAGDGTYKYPTAAVWAGGGYHFLDINNILVTTNANYVFFYIAMANKSFADANPTGFSLALFGFFFADNVLSDGTNELFAYSPGDSRVKDKLNAKLKDRPWDKSAHVMGLGGNMIGAKITNELATFEILQSIDDLKDQKIAVISNAPTVPIITFAFDRKTILTKGVWRFFVTVHNWEDYGLANCIPGVNGHYRDVLNSSTSTYDFISTGTEANLAKFMELAGNPTIDQTTALASSSPIQLSNVWVKLDISK